MNNKYKVKTKLARKIIIFLLWFDYKKILFKRKKTFIKRTRMIKKMIKTDWDLIGSFHKYECECRKISKRIQLKKLFEDTDTIFDESGDYKAAWNIESNYYLVSHIDRYNNDKSVYCEEMTIDKAFKDWKERREINNKERKQYTRHLIISAGTGTILMGTGLVIMILGLVGI